MNRSILIVICDFLLLSLLTFSTDINHMADQNTQRSARVDVVTNNVVEPGKDLAAVMKLSLEEERKNREQLQQQLAQVRNAANQQQSQLTERERENSQLQQQYAMAQTNIEGLSRKLQTTSLLQQESQQQLALSQTDAQKQAELAAALQKQLDQLSRSNQLALTEKQRLANQLQLAEVEGQAASERAALMQQEVQIARTENAQLAEGFKALATNSSQLKQELQENRALAPNTIFSEFVSNRVNTSILASRPTFMGFGGDKLKNAQTILVTDGVNFFALCHVDDTPVTLWDPGTDWNKLTGTLSWHMTQLPIRSLAFDQHDPRVVLIPVTPAEVKKLGCKVYHLSTDPYKFQDAVLVGADEGYYGECNFQIDLATPHYLKLDRSVLKGLFGKFNPSRGDLVLSRTGELLGIMVNNTYCLTIQKYTPGTILAFDQDLGNQHTGATLAQLYDYLFSLSQNLQ
jgi:predicted nuclease with TOPRIM domain